MQKITVCDIFREYGSQYIQSNNIKGQQKGIINLLEHPHLHCIMPAGGLSFDKTHWVVNIYVLL